MLARYPSIGPDVTVAHERFAPPAFTAERMAASRSGPWEGGREAAQARPSSMEIGLEGVLPPPLPPPLPVPWGAWVPPEKRKGTAPRRAQGMTEDIPGDYQELLLMSSCPSQGAKVRRAVDAGAKASSNPEKVLRWANGGLAESAPFSQTTASLGGRLVEPIFRLSPHE